MLYQLRIHGMINIPFVEEGSNDQHNDARDKSEMQRTRVGIWNLLTFLQHASESYQCTCAHGDINISGYHPLRNPFAFTGDLRNTAQDGPDPFGSLRI